MTNATLEELPSPPPGREGWPWTEALQALPPTMVAGQPWPRVSIVTPSFNQGSFLEETIRSVLLQGYPNLQYIIMDGASTDNSPELILKYASWLSHFEIRKDDGQSDALNRGFAHADGELFGFINSDDLLEPSALRSLVLAGSARGASAWQGRLMVAGRCTHFRDGKDGAIGENHVMGSFAQWIEGSAALHQPGTFWTSAIWNECGPFPVGMRYAFDRYFFARVAAFCPEFVRVPASVAKFRVHDLSKSGSEGSKFSAEWVAWVPKLIRSVPASVRLHAAAAILDWYALRVATAALAAHTKSSALLALLTCALRNPLVATRRPFLGALKKILTKKIW